MSNLVEFPLDGGGTVVVATDRAASPDAAAGGGPVFRGIERRDVVLRSSETIQSAIERVKPAAVALVKAFTDMPTRPEGLSVTFGIELNAEVGAVIASTSLSAHFSVTLRWGPDAENAQ